MIGAANFGKMNATYKGEINFGLSPKQKYSMAEWCSCRNGSESGFGWV